VPEALDPDFAETFGILSVHEVKTDPRRGVNIAYASYYNAGFRVLHFGSGEIEEAGFFIDEGGNHFWGVFPIGDEIVGQGYGTMPRGGPAPLVLASDRDSGLYILRFTGRN